LRRQHDGHHRRAGGTCGFGRHPGAAMSATTVLRARRIVTMNPAQPQATHVAVRDGRILAVGDEAAMHAWGPFTADDRYAAQVLLPGFVEGHCHVKEGSIWAGLYLGWFDRTDPRGRTWPGLRSMADVVARLAQAEALLPPGQPLLAWGFDPIYFGGERMTVRHLDTLGSDRPVVITHANGHLMNVNRAMLRQAGIGAGTDVEGVVKFADDEPTGELQEPAAMWPVRRVLGPVGVLGPADAQGLRDFGAVACRHGVTTATDLVNALGPADQQALAAYAEDPGCRVRIVPAFQAFHGTHGAAAGVEHLRAVVASHTRQHLRPGPVKMMLDGSIQGYSARLRWPGYVNGANNGIWVTAPAQFEADFATYHRAGFTIHTHTNGDEASEVAIEAIERVLAAHPRPDHRHTLQHGQMIDRAMFRRMAALGLCANLFANHLWYWGDQHHDLTMGPDRAMRLDACRSALDAGVPLAIHSDAPITPLAPLFTAWCAVNRVTPSGRVLGVAERITVEEALHAITLGAAYTLKLDHEIGSIECGKRADFAVLHDDPHDLPPMALKDARVRGTVLSGVHFDA